MSIGRELVEIGTMAVESNAIGAVCEEDEELTGAVIGKEVEEGLGTDEGTAKGGGTTGMGSDGERKEGRREDVRLGGVEAVTDSVDEV